MTRFRYWKITHDELGSFSYDPKKLLNWDIKCSVGPEDEARFFGVFLYRHGTPFDYTPVKGIVYFYNNIGQATLSDITKFLQKRFGGKDMPKGDRIFLKDSKEIYDAGDVAGLAADLESAFDARSVITLEFEGMTEQEAKDAGLPEAKLLPVPGK